MDRLIPPLMVGLVLLDSTLAGVRAGYGRDGRIRKLDMSLRCALRGLFLGAMICAAFGLLTAIVVSASAQGAAIYASLLAIGIRMQIVFVGFSVLVLPTVGLFMICRHEYRTLATVAILGPLTLARPFVILAATAWGLTASTQLAATLIALLASLAVLLGGWHLDRAFATLTRWTHPAPPPSAAEAEPEPTASSADDVVQVAIEEQIDLHHFAPRDIPSVVGEYLREARDKGFAEVRLIHGRGKGIQRQRVQRILERHPEVVAFRSDGLGSTLATLRPRAARGARKAKTRS